VPVIAGVHWALEVGPAVKAALEALDVVDGDQVRNVRVTQPEPDDGLERLARRGRLGIEMACGAAPERDGVEIV